MLLQSKGTRRCDPSNFFYFIVIAYAGLALSREYCQMLGLNVSHLWDSLSKELKRFTGSYATTQVTSGWDFIPGLVNAEKQLEPPFRFAYH